ncbi:stage V sporulation protein B [Mycoplasmatota bacterium]|nr:stage V sporulation protein B [Mycoplasmatota bacterium]
MKKQTFIQGTIILVVVGMIVKVLGLVNRMVIARLLTSEGIGIYMMVMPTFVLLISLAQLGFPIAISKLVSENNIKQRISNQTIVLKALRISLINSLLLITILLLSAKFLSFNLLNDKRTYYPILSLVFFVPLVSFSSIIKGYLHGYKIMGVPSYSQLIEQIVRITTSISLVIILLPYSIELAVCGAILSMSIGEAISLIYMIYRIKNKRSWNRIIKKRVENKTYEKNIIKDILTISLPATGSRLIGSLSHFFEPIIFSFAMISIGISSHYVTRIYGQITGYTISLLLVPSFLCVAVSIPLIPIISEAHTKKNSEKISHYFNLSIFLSYLSGGIFTIILTLYPNELMKLFFNTTDGVVFLSYMAPLFLFHYFQLPITSTLHAIDKAKSAMMNTLIGAAIKLFLIYILVSTPYINVHGLTTAIIINSIFVTVADFIVLSKTIKMKYNFKTIFTSIYLLIFTYLVGSLLKISQFISNAFINMFILIILYTGIVFLFNIGDIRKIKNQLINH